MTTVKLPPGTIAAVSDAIEKGMAEALVIPEYHGRRADGRSPLQMRDDALAIIARHAIAATLKAMPNTKG